LIELFKGLRDSDSKLKNFIKENLAIF